MPDDADGFTAVTSRKQRKPADFVQCSKANCTGRCPRNVVVQGLRGTGFCPARCRVCDRPSKLVPGAAPTNAGKRPQPTSDALQKFRSEVKTLKAQCKTLQDAASPQGEAPPAEAPRDDGASATEKAAANALQKRIQHFKDMDPVLRDFARAATQHFLRSLRLSSNRPGPGSVIRSHLLSKRRLPRPTLRRSRRAEMRQLPNFNGSLSSKPRLMEKFRSSGLHWQRPRRCFSRPSSTLSRSLRKRLPSSVATPALAPTASPVPSPPPWSRTSFTSCPPR
jgi:hypothetical protein